MRSGKRYSLLREITLFIGVIVLIVSSYFIYRIHTLQSERITKQLATQADRIEKYFIERVNYTGSILGYMGRQIRQRTANSQHADLYYIDQLFQAFTADPNIQNILSSTIIGWVDTDYQAVVDGVLRVMEKPIDLRSRDYIPKTIQKPWVIILGEPVLGSTSGKWIIPAGLAVTDKKDKWLGTLIIGYQQSFLQKNFAGILDGDGVNVALMDLTGQIMVEAPSHFISDNIPLPDKVRNIPLPADIALQVRTPTEKAVPFYHIGYFGWGTSYYYYKIPNYDYIILISLDRPITAQELSALCMEYLPETLTILLFFIMGALFLEMRIVLPIVALSKSASALSEGKVDVIIPRMDNIEAHNLSNALRNVKILIRNEQNFKKELTLAHAEVKLANSSLEQKVIERTASLQQALNAKDEFLNNMSHEIRLPTGVVMGRASMLIEDWDELDEPAKKDHANAIYESCKRLFGLLSNLLDLSKSNAGKMTYKMVASDLGNLVEQAIEEFSAVAAAKKLTITLIKEENAPSIMLDPIRIGQVMRNLLSNAVKFTAEGVLTVTLKSMPLADVDGRNVEGLAFSIKDQGVGIPSDELSSIFDVFIQSSKTRTGAGGTGLGLSISKEIITAHHGILWAENNADGKGSVFTFIIPVDNA